jgi:putative glutamine amidotransferase
MPRPLVAVSAYHLRAGRVAGWQDSAAAVPRAYLDAFHLAGVRPAIVAPPEVASAAEVLSPFAGLALLGGGDVDPDLYGEEPQAEVYGVDAERDQLEVALARQAVADGVPLLAICRGLQVLNVALGGTLHQHLPTVGVGGHGAPEASGESAVHDVAVEPATRLAEALGGAGLLRGCVSIHHQAADRVAPGLVVVGRDVDGAIEALESRRGAGWVLAVQWHPERTASTDPHQQAIFDAFGRACYAE